jgi:drug/metabolite transporter (DMT)-like permease
MNALVGLGLAFIIQSHVVLAVKPLAMLSASGVLNMIAVALAYLSVKHAPASIAAPFHYTQIISGAVIGYLIWGDVPTAHLAIGVIIIVLSCLPSRKLSWECCDEVFCRFC